mmetsp:Transcript_8389/g.24925  ORF Transcript_8389/g.24925 Transcript_8389/m.24925 type:complete len:206 (+) Transcript_8389:516-1133(+)
MSRMPTNAAVPGGGGGAAPRVERQRAVGVAHRALAQSPVQFRGVGTPHARSRHLGGRDVRRQARVRRALLVLSGGGELEDKVAEVLPDRHVVFSKTRRHANVAKFRHAAGAISYKSLEGHAALWVGRAAEDRRPALRELRREDSRARRLDRHAAQVGRRALAGRRGPPARARWGKPAAGRRPRLAERLLLVSRPEPAGPLLGALF